VTTTDHTQQLPPGTPIGMAIGAEIAPAHPAAIETVRVRAEVRRGVHLAAAPPRGHDAGGWGGRGVWGGGVRVGTGVAVWLGGEARKGCGLTLALWRSGRGRRWRRADGGVTWPHPMEHEAQPDECDQRELVEEQMRHHGNTPSYKG